MSRPSTSLPCVRQHAHVAGHSVFVELAFRAGVPASVAIEIHKEGAPLRGLLSEALAGVLTVGLVAGVPLEQLVEPLIGVRCEPCGMVRGHDTITEATSLPDYIGRALLALESAS